MSTSPGKKEQPSTYFVQDRRSQAELERVAVQDHLVTTAMGGPLAEQADPGAFRRVLDIGSGSGGWIIETAQKYPHMSLTGIDISQRMVDYARARALEQNVADRVTFSVMDALRTLEFLDGSFDLVNLRLGVSYIRTWDWPGLLTEMRRVSQPGGVIRLTDQEIIHQSNTPPNSPLRQLNQVLLRGLYRAGHLFEEESAGLTAHLVPLLKRYGVQNVQTKTFTVEYQPGTQAGEEYYRDTMHVYQTLRPFFQKWGCLPENYDALREKGLAEMRQSGFHSTWNFVTAWGNTMA